MENRVFVLTQTVSRDWEGSETSVIGVYSSFEKANAAQKELTKPRNCDDVDWDIECFIIDE